MWRQSKKKAIGQEEMHSFKNHVHFLNCILIKNNKIYVAIDVRNNAVVGMLASNQDEINQLYIHSDYQRQGLGTKFLDIAKSNSNGRLTLFTFEINRQAQLFYEKNGFKIIGRGDDNEENLKDIKYEWVEAGW
jgi:ribosomal protein S18 acetylase RimI-like enzyme